MKAFSYKATKNGKVFIYWRDKLAKTLADQEAKRFVEQAERLDSEQAQLLMGQTNGELQARQ